MIESVDNALSFLLRRRLPPALRHALQLREDTQKTRDAASERASLTGQILGQRELSSPLSPESFLLVQRGFGWGGISACF